MTSFLKGYWNAQTYISTQGSGRVRVHGYRARMATADGRAVIKRRRLRYRLVLASKANNHVKRVRW